MEASGQFRSYNRHEENHNRLVLSVFVRDLHRRRRDGSRETELYLFGWLLVQTTGLSKDTAWKRNCGPFDGCQPSVWQIRLHSLHLLGRNARYADGFGVGEHVQLWGRIQSREYQKQVGDEEYETRVAYEISVSKLEVWRE